VTADYETMETVPSANNLWLFVCIMHETVKKVVAQYHCAATSNRNWRNNVESNRFIKIV